MKTRKEYGAKLMAALITIRNLQLDGFEDEGKEEVRIINVHLDYALKALHEVKKRFPTIPQELVQANLAEIEANRLSARAATREASQSQVAPPHRQWVENLDPDTGIYDFSIKQREHIRDGSYSDLKHSCELCISIDRVVYP